MTPHTFATICFAVLVLSACDRQQRYDSSFLAMGTRIDVSVVSDDPQLAAQATRKAEQSMLQWSQDWYPWGTTPGELKQLNLAFAAGDSFPVSAGLRGLLDKSKQLSAVSDGYFDPAIAPMLQAWGFDGVVHRHPLSPSEQQLSVWKINHPTMQAVIVSSDRVSSTRRDVQLDLGAIAKGYAVDMAMQDLQRQGIESAAINIGGQVTVMGDMDRSVREVQIRDPRLSVALATLVLKNGESIATSGDYERFVMIGGKRFAHVLDPHSGMPVQHTQMVSVVANTATLADAASTALMAAGPENWRKIAKQLTVSQVLRVDATGEIQVTGAMYARLRWNRSAMQTHRIIQVKLPR